MSQASDVALRARCSGTAELAMTAMRPAQAMLPAWRLSSIGNYFGRSPQKGALIILHSAAQA